MLFVPPSRALGQAPYAGEGIPMNLRSLMREPPAFSIECRRPAHPRERLRVRDKVCDKVQPPKCPYSNRLAESLPHSLRRSLVKDTVNHDTLSHQARRDLHGQFLLFTREQPEY